MDKYIQVTPGLEVKIVFLFLQFLEKQMCYTLKYTDNVL